jgi:hypothetical protein
MERESFNFSQDLIGGLSQMSAQLPGTADCTWLSGDSQSLLQSQVSRRVDQIVPHVLADSKKTKYNVPKWTKGLLKTAEDNQKLRNHEMMLKKQDDDNRDLTAQLFDIQSGVRSLPTLMVKAVKESTNYVCTIIDETRNIQDTKVGS